MLSSGLVLGLGDWGGASLGPDAGDCVLDLLLETSDQLAVGVDLVEDVNLRPKTSCATRYAGSPQHPYQPPRLGEASDVE